MPWHFSSFVVYILSYSLLNFEVDAMEYEYTVEAFDFVKNITIVTESFSDANNAYQMYRHLSDVYHSEDNIQVQLHEPE